MTEVGSVGYRHTGQEWIGNGSRGSETAQGADDVFDFILLKQPDGGNAGGSGFEAGRGVGERDAAEGEDGNLRPAGFAQGGEAGGLSAGAISFLEYRGEDGKVGSFRLGVNDIGGSVAGNGDEEVVSGQWPVASKPLDNASDLRRRNIIRAQVDAVGARGQGDVGAGVD